MGSTLTKEDLIRRILKATAEQYRINEITESRLLLLPMKDLWAIERAIVIDKMRGELETIS